MKIKNIAIQSLASGFKLAAGNLQIQDLEQIDQWLMERKPPEQVIAEEAAAAASGS